MDGPWGWSRVAAEDLIKLPERMRSFESMTWLEIEQQVKSCGLIDVSRLCSEAQERLVEIRLDDIDQLYKLRITQKGRLWGIRDRQILKILWWDPEHTVYPMNIPNN